MQNTTVTRPTEARSGMNRMTWWGLLGALALFVGGSATVRADDPLAITETRTPMSRGTQPALMVTIPKAQLKAVDAAWKDLLKDYKAKLKVDKGEIFADNAAIKAIGDNTVDVYSRLTETKEGVLVQVFIDLGGAFMSAATHPEQYKAAENIVYQFAVEQTRVAVGVEIAAAQKILEKMQKEQKKLESDEKDLSREIDKDRQQIKGLEEQIQDTQKLIEENKKAQSAGQVQLDQQKAALDALVQKQKAVR